MRFLETRALTVTPRQFDRQLSILSRFLNFVSPADLWGPHAQNSLPARPTLLTFDDGTQGLLDHALPILKKHQIQSLCFAAIEHHQGEAPLPYWWDLADPAYDQQSGKTFSEFLLELRQKGCFAAAAHLSEASKKVHRHRFPMTETGLKKWTEGGQFLGSHANRHDPLAQWRGPDATDPSRIQALAGSQYFPALAFPYGELPPGAFVEPTVQRTLNDQGFRAAFGTHAGLASRELPGSIKPTALPRLLVASQWSIPRLLAKIASLSF